MKQQNTSDSKKKLSVLVAGAHSMGALGVIRSLGRAGYTVHAVAASQDAIGLKSNFATTSSIHPTSNSTNFEQWIVDFIQKNNISMIIAGGPISPNNPALRNYSHLFPTNKNESIPEQLAKGRKYELFELLLAGDDSVSKNLPPVLLVNFEEKPVLENEILKLV